jgi:cytoskeletal protein RodZ
MWRKLKNVFQQLKAAAIERSKTMKKVHLILLIIYVFITLYFAIFNWEVFIVNLGVSLGFAVIKLPLVAMIFLFALIFLLIQWGLAHLNESKHIQRLTQKDNEISSLEKEYELESMKKENEINALKASFYDEQVEQIKENSESIIDLQAQLNKIMEVLPVKVDEEKVGKIPAEEESSI